MALLLKGEAEFEHDGAAVRLTMNVAVLLRAEQDTGYGVFELFARVQSALHVTATLLRLAVIEAGGDDRPVEEWAEVLMLNGDAREAVLRALNAALPDAKEKDENPPNPARRRRSGTGTKS